MARREKQNQSLGKQKDAGKIKPLKLKKQTVRDLSVEEAGMVKGATGTCGTAAYTARCGTTK
jgi:hypothetical protein